ncbi:MAG: orotate phosphoribosyltransferase [Anaerolineales bacterium]|nr:orotate phosphoribosyltransferase [Anaerolineales bacterium]
MTPDLEKLALTLFEIDAVRLGDFTLHSGRKSPIYLDLRVLVSYPHALRLATAAYRSVLDTLSFDLIAATPLAGLPIGTAICLAMDRPLIYPRKTAKSYGTGKSVEGVWQVGQRAVVVDDLVTSGDSILQAIMPLKGAGLQVTDAVVLVDRQQGGAESLQELGYRLHAVLTLPHLLLILQENGRITPLQRDRVLKSLRGE